MDYLSTSQAATELGISTRRVQTLIASGRLKAERVGREWLIAPADLEAVRVRKPGRPPKA
jgi:excisionase family DNA binding protein